MKKLIQKKKIHKKYLAKILYCEFKCIVAYETKEMT